MVLKCPPKTFPSFYETFKTTYKIQHNFLDVSLFTKEFYLKATTTEIIATQE